jgi:2-polyprenyl-6-methoxyphenol hydroxylase-like FAD-dependent oxidoreductase
MNDARRHAIVIGASMGGLVAAAAVAPFYEKVTVLERDELPTTPAHRRGVPQSKHAHGFQPGGLDALEELLPGVLEELVTGGARVGDVSGRVSWFVGGGRLARSEMGHDGIGLTRPFLEHTVRARVAALPNVRIHDGFEVTGLVTAGAPGRARVVGVAGSTEPGTVVELAADFVIDASGRRSRLPDWLTALGYPAPAEEQVHCRMAYLSRRWQLTSTVLHEDVICVVAPADRPVFGVAIAQEDGTHIVTLGGLLDGAPAKDDEAYLGFARALPDQRIADALVGAEPATDYQPSHFPYSRRRRYDRLRTFPLGLLALGDSIASFNPMYGQGMSVAALEAVALRDALRGGPVDPRKFFKRAHRIEDVAWKISTGGDLRFDEVEGRRTPDVKVMNSYLDRLAIAARRDPVLAEAFLSVAGFLSRPESLFRPGIVRRVITGSRAARRAGEPLVHPEPGALESVTADANPATARAV